MSILKTIALGAALTIVTCLCSATINKKKECNTIKFTFKVWHADEFDKPLYTKIKTHFSNLRKLFLEGEISEPEFGTIAKILGTPFDQIMAECKKRDDITGGITLNIEEEKSMELELSLSHKESFDQTAWLRAVSTAAGFFAEPNWMQKLTPIFADAINASKESGIHGSLNLEFQSATE